MKVWWLDKLAESADLATVRVSSSAFGSAPAPLIGLFEIPSKDEMQ